MGKEGLVPRFDIQVLVRAKSELRLGQTCYDCGFMNGARFTLIRPIAAIFLSIVIFAIQADGDTDQPNVIIVMVDDMGFAGPSIEPYNNSNYRTPGMDLLAEEGMRFTDFHSSGTVCSPTRAGLLTGRYQQRTGIEAVIHPYSEHPEHRKGLRKSEVTFAELFKGAGYATGIVGKWHLGYPNNNSEFHPENHGFDYFRGYHSGNIDYINHWGDHYEHDWWHGQNETKEKGYSTHLINRYALEFIEQNKDQPFCLYVAHESPHAPVQGPDDPVQRGPGAKVRETPAAEAMKQMILEMDKGVRQIRDKVVDLGLEKRTLIFFLSDNGPASGTATDSEMWRGKKASVYEGGHRVPAIAWWPGKIRSGSITDTLSISLDLMPTMLSVAGIEIPKGRLLDGVDLSSVLFTEKDLPPRPLYWASMGNGGQRSEAMRDGPWKLVVQHPGAKEGTFENESVELYRLDRDPGERTDLAQQEADRTADMLAQLKEWFSDTQRTATPQPGGWEQSKKTADVLNAEFKQFQTSRQKAYDERSHPLQSTPSDTETPALLRPLVRPVYPVLPFERGFAVESGQTAVILGSTNAYECGKRGYLETLLLAAYPDSRLRFRNMAWQADTVYRQQRPRNFFEVNEPDYGERDNRMRTEADIVFLWMGQSESLDGVERVESFAESYLELLREVAVFTARIVLVTPVPFHDVMSFDNQAQSRNETLAVYVDSIKKIGRENNLPVVDLFRTFNSEYNGRDWSRNGLHLSQEGQWLAARSIAAQLGFADDLASVNYNRKDGSLNPASVDSLRLLVERKNDLWLSYWRPTNWAFLYGNRQSQPSSHDHINRDTRWFPDEILSIIPLIEETEETIFSWTTRTDR